MISYRPSFIPNKIVIIGAGGTGSRLVPLVSQFIKTCAWVLQPEIHLIDDDVVEDKNLLRQNFIATDVGKKKAEVLAQRYSRAFDITIHPHTFRVVHPNVASRSGEQTQVFQDCARNVIVVMCVDSPQARKDILQNVLTNTRYGSQNCLLLDSGNENDYGQVSVSTSTCLRQFGRTVITKLQDMTANMGGTMDIPNIPLNLPYYSKMQAVSGGSCADLDQTMAINSLMANTMFSIIQNFYYAKPITFHRLNVDLSNGITPEYMNPKFLLERAKDDYFTFGDPYSYVVDLEDIVNHYHRNTFSPFKEVMNNAVKIQENELAAKKLAERIEADKKAVQDAMKKYGWTLPKTKTEAMQDLLKVLGALQQPAATGEKAVTVGPEVGAIKAEEEKLEGNETPVAKKVKTTRPSAVMEVSGLV